MTAGGRVLAVSARGDGVAQARERAYAAADLVAFEGRQMRRDIAAGMEAEVRGRVIPRYSRPAMAAIWTEEAKLARWLEVELAVCRAWGARGVIPPEDLADIEGRAGFTVERTQELERTTDHDVVAFLTDVAERVGPASRWVHYGLTSSDVLDTGLALAIAAGGRPPARGTARPDGDAARAGPAPRRHALRRAHARRARRAHDLRAQAGRLRDGEPAQRGAPGRGGPGAARWASSRARSAPTPCSTRSWRPRCCASSGIGGEPVATQVVARDRHAQLVAAMAVAASSLDRLATELRHLQRTELREAEEAFAAGQKGSSAMPHKRNPITAERISGLARVVRGHAVAALEDVALWHERDISHSSVERVILPDAFLALDYMLARSRTLLEGLVVRPERMRAILELVARARLLAAGAAGRSWSGGLTREQAYALVQRNAMRAWEEDRPLADLLSEDAEVTAVIPRDELRALLDPSWYTRHVPAIMDRVAAL